MADYVHFALEKLKKAGFKITGPRQQIVALLFKTEKALSPYEMRDVLRKRGARVDVVTIYRVLETLEKLGLVHKVLALNAYVRCDVSEQGTKEPCHHYLLCRRCHAFIEFTGTDTPAIRKTVASLQKKFHVESHYLELVGLCASCAALNK